MAAPALHALALDHVGIAVEEVEAAVEMYRGLLGEIGVEVIEWAPQQVRVAILFLGESKIELLEGIGPDSPITKFVEARGPGLHHICYAVPDLRSALARARDLGFEPLGDGSEIGVEGRPVVFLHPRSTGGVLTELTEGFEPKR